jgi:O-antigen ligase
MSYLLAIIIFLIPSNLFLKISESTGYVNGLFIDYLIPKLYLSDIFLIILLSIWFIKSYKQIRFTFSLLFIPLLILFMRQFFVTNQIAAFWYLIKLIEIGLFLWYLSKNQNQIKQRVIHFSIIAAILFQSLLAIYQYHTQHSFFGYLFLGEANIPQALGLAKTVINGVEKIEPYGTTAHPNILAGVLCIYILYMLCIPTSKKRVVQLIKVVAIILGAYVIFLTQSLSAILSLILGGFLIYSKKRVDLKALTLFAIAIIILAPIGISMLSLKYSNVPSLSRRDELQKNAISVLLKNPLFGVGLNQFTTLSQNFNDSKELVRFVQPVHHIGLLWLAETGLIGLACIFILVKKLHAERYAVPLLLLTPIAALDHYLMTQQTGLLLFSFTLIFFNKRFTPR